MKRFIGICKGGPYDGQHLEHDKSTKPIVLNFDGRLIDAKYVYDGHSTWRFESKVLLIDIYKK